MALMQRTWDDARLKRDRLRQLQQVMRRKGVGGLYLNEIVNVRYAVNVRIPGGSAFVPAEGEPVIFVRSMDQGYVRLAHSDVRPRIYRVDPTDSEADGKALKWADELDAIMTEFDAHGAPLGIDSLDPIGFIALGRRNFRLVNAGEILELAKAVKTQDEVLIYEEMGKLYGVLMRNFRERAVPGITEQELSSVIYAKAIELGAEGLLQINVCSAQNMNPWRRWPTERRLADGDLVGLDLHVYGPGGYIFDSSRTYLCGSRASDKQRDRYRRAHEYVNAVIGLFKPGISIEEVKAKLPKVPESFHEQLYSFHIAHSNGLTPGEYPSIMKHQKPVPDTIKQNMVLSADCYFGEVGDDVAVKLEDQILVTAAGARKMADMPYEERLL